MISGKYSSRLEPLACIGPVLYKLGIHGILISLTSFSWVKFYFFVSLAYFLNRDYVTCTR